MFTFDYKPYFVKRIINLCRCLQHWRYSTTWTCFTALYQSSVPRRRVPTWRVPGGGRTPGTTSAARSRVSPHRSTSTTSWHTPRRRLTMKRFFLLNMVRKCPLVFVGFRSRASLNDSIACTVMALSASSLFQIFSFFPTWFDFQPDLLLFIKHLQMSRFLCGPYILKVDTSDTKQAKRIVAKANSILFSERVSSAVRGSSAASGTTVVPRGGTHVRVTLPRAGAVEASRPPSPHLRSPHGAASPVRTARPQGDRGKHCYSLD